MGKGDANKSGTKKKNNDLVTSILFVVAIFALAITAIVYTKSQQNKKKNTVQEEDNPFLPHIDYEAESAAYSAGLNDNGSIAGVNNINDYVKLGETDGIVLYKADYATATDSDIMKAGDYLISKVVESSEIKDNEEYYMKMRALYDHIARGWYDSYCEASAGQEGVRQYASFEEFLLGSQGMDADAYKNFLDTNAGKDVKKYLVVQAIAEKAGINVSEEDINAYAQIAIDISKSPLNVENTKKRFGLPYMYQRTAEFAVDRYLIEHAVIKEGSIKDNWTDNSSVYSAGLYSNGKISGIGNINNYVKITDEITDHPSVDAAIDFYMENAEFTDYADYLEKVEAVCKLKNGSEKSDAVYEMHYRMLIQSLFDRYELDIASYRSAYNNEKTVDEIEEEKYSFGEPYVNQLIMEYAVKQKLAEIYSTKPDAA